MANMTSEGIMVSVRVLPEIYYCLEKEIAQINATGEIQWQERKVNKESIINAILADYLSRPKTERRPVLRSSTRTVEMMLEARDTKETDEARLFVGRPLDREALATLLGSEEAEAEIDMPKPVGKRR